MQNKNKNIINFFGRVLFPFLNFYFLIFYSGSLEVIDPILLLIPIYIIYFIQIIGKHNWINHKNCHHWSMNTSSSFYFLFFVFIFTLPSQKCMVNFTQAKNQNITNNLHLLISSSLITSPCLSPSPTYALPSLCVCVQLQISPIHKDTSQFNWVTL